MEVILKRRPREENDAPSAVAMGLFDGVHIGHQMVIGAAKAAALAGGLRLAVFTFPQKNTAAHIQTAEQKHGMLAELGVDICYEPPFSAFRAMSPDEFFEKMLLGEYGAKALACGENFHFGEHRSGSPDTLRTLCSLAGIALNVVPLAQYKGEAASSTRIREALAAGRVDDAGAMLGRPYAINAEVRRGNGLGHTLGFPTLNQEFGEGICAPAFGVYATAVFLDGRLWPSVTGWGLRPTVGGTSPTCETFIPGFSGSLYGRRAEVRFYRRIDDVKKFDSQKELARAVQIWAKTALDVIASLTRNLLP